MHDLQPSSPRARDIEALLDPTPYQVVRFLGRGGMGEVFVVEHRFLGRRFALKLLNAHLSTAPELVDRLRIEAQATARLQHPNIVEVIDFWVGAGGVPCIVMELLEGRTLAEELTARGGRLPMVEAVELACQALAGLGAAHAAGIVHRDAKPENLYLHEIPGYRRTLKILDFGLARVLPNVSERAPSPLAVPTTTGTLLGSPRFMAPEAARGERVDSRADLYSLGLVLYEMLAGQGPYDMATSQPEAPSRHGPDVSTPELDRVVLRAIGERPEERYQTAEQLRAELKRCIETLKPGAPRLR